MRPETDYERWLEEQDQGRKPVEGAYYHRYAPDITEQPDSSFTTQQGILARPGLTGEEAINRQSEGDKKSTFGSTYGTLYTPPTVGSSPASRTLCLHVSNPNFRHTMLLCFFAFSLLVFLTRRRAARPREHIRIFRMPDRQPATLVQMDRVVNDCEV